MKDKVLLYVIGIMIAVVVVQSVQIYVLKQNSNLVLEAQSEELELLKQHSRMKSDSISILISDRMAEIERKQKKLNAGIVKTNENNLLYEQIKKNIIHTNDADSLASQLTKRYYKR